MVGIVVILLVSWFLLHYFENKNLTHLGFLLNKKPAIEFIVGIGFIVILTLFVIGIDTFTYKIDWQIKTEIDHVILLQSFWYHLKSALTEDLVFRGALLIILVSKLGFRKGICISAAVFGIYHWFSFDMLKAEIRIIPLLYVFLATGATGFAWAFAFIKTKSIMMPLGFHVGSNFLFSLFYKDNAYGELIYSQSSRIGFENEWINLLYLVIKGLMVPYLTVLFVNYWVQRNAHKHSE